VTQKGGSGKSTLASAVAVAAMQAGEAVLVLDLDPQATLAEWAKLRGGKPPAVARAAAQSAQIPALIETARQSYSLVILDTPGADSPATHNAMLSADLCLVPLRPTRPDALALRPTVDALIRAQRRFAFILSQAPSRSSRASEMAAGLVTLGMCAEPVIGLRADYQDSFAAGQGPTEYAPQSKAATEISQLWKWINDEAA
jgi:chromosome partitioning protein